MERMILVLTPDREQRQALDELLAKQQDPASSHYHQWLTPAEYASHFAVSDGDLEKVTDWLTDLGFTVDEIPAGRGALLFSGPASLVESAFHLRINRYTINGVPHIANARCRNCPQPGRRSWRRCFAARFRSQPLHAARIATPAYTSGSNHYLAPADFAAIYDVAGLYSQYYDGTGQTIAIVGRSNLHLSDIRQFRSSFGLHAKDPAVILNGSDPGTASSGDVSEATLDVEWAGAVAKNATIDFVASASTSVSDGTYLSAQYIVNHNLASVMSVSYGLCEAWLGTAENAFLNSLWQQAAAQGISVFVSSGDSGAAGCDASNAARATSGPGVNGLCSTPYSTCVGGTQFSDTASPALYWNTTNTSSGSSARGYIPESAWNEAGGSGLWSSGGGASTIYAKPSWQNASGVPADGMRDVPDVALNSAGHDGYLVTMNGGNYVFSGTSAAAPSFAGLMALVAQSSGSRQGNANPTLYRLAARQQAGTGAAVFHDATTGSNSVPGVRIQRRRRR
jgi:subtilase family serine protease